MRPPESLKSHKTVYSDNHGHTLLEQYETQASFRNFYLRKNVLISSGMSNDVKIRIWSKSLRTRLQTTTGFIEIPWRPKILRTSLGVKSLGISTSYFEHYRFTCGDKNPWNFLACTKYYDQDCLRKQFFAISVPSTFLGAKRFHFLNQENHRFREMFFTHLRFFISVPQNSRKDGNFWQPNFR